MAYEAERHAAAKAHLYDVLRPPAFLRRNVKQALDYIQDQQASRAVGGATEILPPTQSFRDFEPLPMDKAKDVLMGSTKPKLTVKSIILRDAKRERRVPPATAISPRSDDDWLPRPDELRLPCRVQFTIHQLTSHMKKSAETVVVKTEISGTIHKHGNNRSTMFQVILDKPFTARVDQVITKGSEATYNDDDDDRNIKQTQLEVNIQLAGSMDSAELMARLEDVDIENFRAASASFGSLIIIWSFPSVSPTLPELRKLLPVTRRAHSKDHSLRFGAEIDVGWTKQMSPVIHYNNAVAAKREKNGQMPTPASGSRRGSLRSQLKVKYLIHVKGYKTKSAVVKDYTCFVCQYAGPHPSLERLQLHFATDHGHLSFEVEEEDDYNNIQIIRVLPGDDRGLNRLQWSWDVPAEPFDIPTYLEGESVWHPRDGAWRNHVTKDVWVDESPRRPGSSGRAKPSPIKGRGNKNALERPQSSFKNTVAKRKAPEDVQDLPVPKRRKNVIPNLPGGGRIYWTSSMQQAEPGASMANSDDVMDPGWMAQRQRQELAQLGIDEHAQFFHQMFNKHLDEERPKSDLLLGDAVVRFTRKIVAVIKDGRDARKYISDTGSKATIRAPCPRNLKMNFLKKLDLLHGRKIIADEINVYCRGLLPKDDEIRGPVSDEASQQTDASEKQPRRVSPRGSRKLSDQQNGDTEKPPRRISPRGSRTPAKQNQFEVEASDREVPKSPSLSTLERLQAKKGKGKEPVKKSPAEVSAKVTKAKQKSTRAAGKKTAYSRACVCGELVTYQKRLEAIACGNLACGREFHLRCVGLTDRKKRTKKWRCESCSKK